MPTAPGTLVRNGANKITLTFSVDGVQFTFVGVMDPAMPPFNANQVTLTYNSVNELSSTVSFDGKIGPEHFRLNLSNGVTAKGDLDFPLSPASLVSGSGTWTQN
ncbi:hypothetical protein FPSE_08923 [Fusarium pseudograminearum CS3096]|uniref:Uncharacterized protein n=1 Tax=Fusarium pseudograminearum (strain CS3096) TaxID=1028729 RepID=K3VAT5_FUSPC|nr:hypothetical protein FPSE_08923 [Fusarium pseudograminearum CS3096]EKJ70872.1 hypothetical protein FPSE_08923 [Fusarium pseudograminearum CS3096]